MSIESPDDLQGLKNVSEVIKVTFRALTPAVLPGVTTGELDRLAWQIFERYGAVSAPALEYGFPGTILISVNDEAVHGIPGARMLEAGDLVTLDVTPALNGYISDAAISLAVPPVTPVVKQLMRTTQTALRSALRRATVGTPVNELGRIIEHEVTRNGFSVIAELAGHGVGRSIHEAPTVPNVYEPDATTRLTKGLVLTIEPIVAAGRGAVYLAEDGWTVQTYDESPVAHFEHTLVITGGQPLVLTA